jgi:exodeoxyribonuclease V alpha subunit
MNARNNTKALTIQGQIENIITVKSNGYVIARFKPHETNASSIRIIGNGLPTIAGAIIELQGVWINHPKYGDQFIVHSFEILHPDLVVAIRDRLLSIKGIGNVIANRIVAKHGI